MAIRVTGNVEFRDGGAVVHLMPAAGGGGGLGGGAAGAGMHDQFPPSYETMLTMPIHPSRSPLTRADAIQLVSNMQRFFGLATGWWGEWTPEADARLTRTMGKPKRGAGAPDRLALPAPAQLALPAQEPAPAPVAQLAPEVAPPSPGGLALLDEPLADVEERVSKKESDTDDGDNSDDSSDSSSDSSKQKEKPISDDAVIEHHLYEQLSAEFDDLTREKEQIEEELDGYKAKYEALVAQVQSYELEIEELRAAKVRRTD